MWIKVKVDNSSVYAINLNHCATISKIGKWYHAYIPGVNSYSIDPSENERIEQMLNGQ